MYGIKILKEYALGDMVARYVTDGADSGGRFAARAGVGSPCGEV